MKLPNHIILDFLNTSNNNSTNYWLSNLINSNQNNLPSFLKNEVILNKIEKNKSLKTKILKKKQFNLSYKNQSLKTLKKVILNTTYVPQNSKLNTLLNTVNVIFLRKEPIYTKLKYSRTAAYDIVGGGAALFLAGLFGFLITEKFGFELVDSGDFYYLFMYGVFLTFSLRPLLVILNPDKSFFNAISLKPVIEFYKTITSYFINFFK